MKKIMFCLLLSAFLCTATACGDNNTTNQDNQGTTTEDNNNSTNGNNQDRNGPMADDGIVGETGEALKDGAEDIGNDVERGMDNVEDSMENNGNNAREDGTTR